MHLMQHLSFNGTCAEAFRFYEQCLRGELQTIMTHGESPMAAQTPPEWKDRVMHAALKVNGNVLMGADVPPDSYKQPTGFAVAIQLEDAAEAERIFGALAEKGTVTLALQQTFWAERFGMLVDRFGIPWMINCGTTA